MYGRNSRRRIEINVKSAVFLKSPKEFLVIFFSQKRRFKVWGGFRGVFHGIWIKKCWGHRWKSGIELEMGKQKLRRKYPRFFDDFLQGISANGCMRYKHLQNNTENILRKFWTKFRPLIHPGSLENGQVWYVLATFQRSSRSKNLPRFWHVLPV